MPSCKVYMLQVKPGLRLNPFLHGKQTKDFILITPHPNIETETSFNDSYY